MSYSQYYLVPGDPEYRGSFLLSEGFKKGPYILESVTADKWYSVTLRFKHSKDNSVHSIRFGELVQDAPGTVSPTFKRGKEGIPTRLPKVLHLFAHPETTIKGKKF